jgi:hypothetical protein
VELIDWFTILGWLLMSAVSLWVAINSASRKSLSGVLLAYFLGGYLAVLAKQAPSMLPHQADTSADSLLQQRAYLVARLRELKADQQQECPNE